MPKFGKQHPVVLEIVVVVQFSGDEAVRTRLDRIRKQERPGTSAERYPPDHPAARLAVPQATYPEGLLEFAEESVRADFFLEFTDEAAAEEPGR